MARTMIMPNYTVEFDVELHRKIKTQCPTDFTKENSVELLKEFVSVAIQKFMEGTDDTMNSYPQNIKLWKDKDCILQCDDLTEKSFNRITSKL